MACINHAALISRQRGFIMPRYGQQLKVNDKISTPYSTNRLFSELFKKIEGAFLEVCETISRGYGEVFRGEIEENYPENNQKNQQILLDTINYYSR